MKYEVVRAVLIGGKHYGVGDTINELNKADADYLVARKWVKEVKEPAKKTAKSKG